MASSEDLKTMVTSFRVSELQVLLGFAGRSKSGKKHELMGRAIVLVERGCSTPIQIKIRELYKRRFPSGPPQGKSAGSSSPVKSASPHRHAPYPGGITSGQPPGYHSSSTSTSYQSKPSASSLLGRQLSNMAGAASSQHTIDYNSSSSRGSSLHNQVPVHPDVRFKRLAFYDILGELLKPSSLVSKNSSRFQETYFVFHLTPQQSQDIAMSRDLRPSARNEYTVQVQIRFCLLETTCQQKDEFPPSICVRVNGKMAPLPNPIPTNKPGVEPKRPSRPVNVTALARISPTVSNHISISWASELGRSYCVCVDLVRKLNAEILLARLKQKGTKHPDHTRALIKEKLAHDPDSEIATTSLRVSLLCPLGKMRMTLPCRANTCSHLQCFDSPTFLQMNEKKPTWQCPVCDRPTEFDNLIIDGLFSEILKSAEDATEIQFSEDGSWQPMKPKEKGRITPEPITMIGGDETPTPAASSSTSGSGHGGEGDTSGGGSNSSSNKKNVDIIDLTASDDEDDMPEALPGSPYSSDSNPSVISTKPPPELSNNSCMLLDSSSSSAAAAVKSGCVSPPIISLDSPSRHSYTSIHSPPSMSSYSPTSVSSRNRSPQSVTPLSAPRSPYASSSQNSLSPRVVHSPALSTSSPSLTMPPLPAAITHLPFAFPTLASSSSSSLFSPPPAHSNNSRPTPPPLTSLMFQSLYGSDSLGETDFENLLGLMGEYHRGGPPAAHQSYNSAFSNSRGSSPLGNLHQYRSSVPVFPSSSTYDAGSYALPLTTQERRYSATPSPPLHTKQEPTLMTENDPLMSTP